MQVYRFMDIGTAKASVEEQQRVRHHLLDVVDPDENYDAARFAHDALEAIGDIHRRNLIPLLTGGTGLYLRALLNGIFPVGG
jgi:tRNA dimethylallyltransferase